MSDNDGCYGETPIASEIGAQETTAEMSMWYRKPELINALERFTNELSKSAQDNGKLPAQESILFNIFLVDENFCETFWHLFTALHKFR